MAYLDSELWIFKPVKLDVRGSLVLSNPVTYNDVIRVAWKLHHLLWTRIQWWDNQSIFWKHKSPYWNDEQCQRTTIVLTVKKWAMIVKHVLYISEKPHTSIHYVTLPENFNPFTASPFTVHKLEYQLTHITKTSMPSLQKSHIGSRLNMNKNSRTSRFP